MIPIIALTALAMPGDRERCLGMGANDYMTKPVRLQELATAIETQLTRARQAAKDGASGNLSGTRMPS
jgi:DNA-binding response OmpR family regulator